MTKKKRYQGRGVKMNLLKKIEGISQIDQTLRSKI